MSMTAKFAESVSFEVRTVLTSVMSFTRIRIPVKFHYSEELMSGILKYFPLAGWITGSLSALIYWLSVQYFDKGISALLVICTAIMTSGAMHEDGLADVCDGFGGGWNKEKILSIMKDSRIGSFGTVGLIITIMLRYKLIEGLSSSIAPAAIIAASAFSRFAPLVMLCLSDYVRTDNSKSGYLDSGIRLTHLVIAFIIGASPFLLLNNERIWSVMLLPVLAALYMNSFFKKWIGGLRGDCLGAVQQIAEILTYAGILVVL